MLLLAMRKDMIYGLEGLEASQEMERVHCMVPLDLLSEVL
jgi:hypothetical protein